MIFHQLRALLSEELGSRIYKSGIIYVYMGCTMYAIGGPALSLIKFRFWQKHAVGEIIKFTIFSSIVAVNKYGIASLISK
jgi:hypothetical protein